MFTIILPLESGLNFQQNCNISYQTWSMLLHYLGKLKFKSVADYVIQLWKIISYLTKN